MIFICFSHIERYIVAQSLSYHLKNYGYQIWYDYDELFIGDDGDYLKVLVQFQNWNKYIHCLWIKKSL